MIKSPVKEMGCELDYSEGTICLNDDEDKFFTDSENCKHKVLMEYRAYFVSSRKLSEGIILLRFLLSKESKFLTSIMEPTKLREGYIWGKAHPRGGSFRPIS